MSTKSQPGGKAKLTLLQERFVAEYLGDITNAAAAYVRAGGSKRSAKARAYELLQKPEVVEAIRVAQEKSLQRAEIKQDDVLRALKEIAFADPRELSEYRRTCCRYCWGRGHRYHWTPAEFAAQTKEVEFWNSARDTAKRKPLPDCDGGLDFDRTRDPNPACPECRGTGTGHTFFHDTRRLSTIAARLRFAPSCLLFPTKAST